MAIFMETMGRINMGEGYMGTGFIMFDSGLEWDKTGTNHGIIYS